MDYDENITEVTCPHCGRHYNTESEGRCSCDFAEVLSKEGDKSNNNED